MGGGVDRRSVLRAVGLTGTALLSGCLLFGWDNPELEELAVTVSNDTESPHTFSVRLFDEAGATVFDEVFPLEADGRESRDTDFTGTEYRVLVDVDGSQELDDTWHWGGCRSDEVRVTFWSATEGNAGNTCSTD